MSTPENNNDPINKNQARKEIEAKIENIRRIFEELASKQLSQENLQVEPINKPKPIDNNMMFFSLDPSGCEFPPNAPTEWMESACPPPDGHPRHAPKISPDVEDFLVGAGALLYAALYSPFTTGNGRMTKFFAWVDAARSKMSNERFSDFDRKTFSDWCRSAGETLQESTHKGLWLSDSEDGFVAAMSSGKIMSISETDSNEDTL